MSTHATRKRNSSHPDTAITEAQVKATLAMVPDPELAFMTLADFGVLRDVALTSGRNDAGVHAATVTITPKYTGCPATAMMQADIHAALTKLGIPVVEIKLQLDPVWTTDWITPAGREKLTRNGYSAPGQVRQDATGFIPLTLDAPALDLKCPNCESANTRRISDFGSCPCKALYACNGCGESFEHFKEF